ncbi:hypothetical protein POM88_015218 [Heracleum sosnowskyi]|uniref:Uncharacterized protein n=1 Tax=Heracleum sosnowskyi TaxID=360622 RepID=A0AAD8IN81_9APIA|nr:hypothetical protein POM88_015218 [Heracleum sosnowskyi]
MQTPPRTPQTPPKAVGEWTTPLWGCFSDWGNCITTLFCPCVTYGQIANIVDQGKTTCFTGGKTYLTLMSLTCGCCLYSCFARSKLRFMYNLPPSPCSCGDCVVHACCEPCALCQEYRELKNRGYNMSIGYDLNKTTVGTVAPLGQMMTQIDNMSNHPNGSQNGRYDNQNNRQNGSYKNDSYNNQNMNQRQNDAPLSQMMGQMDINSNDRYNNQNNRQNDHYDNQNMNRPQNDDAPLGQMMDQMDIIPNDLHNNVQNNRPNDRYDNRNNRQNDRPYNNQNMNRQQNDDAPLGQMMDQMDIIPNDLQNIGYNNVQNSRLNDRYDNRNNRQNAPYNNQNMNRRQNDAPLNQMMMDQMDINPNDRQHDRYNNQNQNNRQNDQQEDQEQE